MLLIIGAHWSPLELKIVDEGKSNMIKKFLSIGTHWSPLESIGVVEFRWDLNVLDRLVLTIGAHWSPLELENSDGINIFWTLWSLSLEPIGVHWSWRL